MTFLQEVVAGGCGLPRNRALRARLKPHLDADPELLAALLIHLELARDDQLATRRRPERDAPTTSCPSNRRAD